MDTTLDLAIVRNRLLANKHDDRDQTLLNEIRDAAAIKADRSVYARIVAWAISNALADIEIKAYNVAAREMDLAHNIKCTGDVWSPSNEEYFIRGIVMDYMEHAPLERIKGLFALFKGGTA